MGNRLSGELKITIVEPEGGYDEKRLQMALSLLISEKDFIDYFRRLHSDSNSPSNQTLQPKGLKPPGDWAANEPHN
jgi:hypothetical protein